MRMLHMAVAMAAMYLPAPAVSAPAIMPAAVSAQEAKRRARREIYATVSPRDRRCRNAPPKRKLHTNLRHRSRRVRRKHRRTK